MQEDAARDLRDLRQRLDSFCAAIAEKCQFVRQNVQEGLRAAETLEALAESGDLAQAAPDQLNMMVTGVAQILRAQASTLVDVLGDLDALPHVVTPASGFDESQLLALRDLGLAPQG